MELPEHKKLIENFINKNDAMSLLFDTYEAMSNREDRDKFVLALIGHAVISHKLLETKMK